MAGPVETGREGTVVRVCTRVRVYVCACIHVCVEKWCDGKVCHVECVHHGV